MSAVPSSAPAMVPHVAELRRPPHDPLFLRLGGPLGWPVVTGTVSSDPPATLELPRLSATLRRLTEPSGSLGGLRAPAATVVGHDDTVWLLTPEGRLRRLDPCDCRFEDVPCLPPAARHPGPAGALAWAAGHLFVTDPAGGRVQVLLTPQLVLRGVWTAPMPWTPVGVAVDARFRVHVADPRNGMVHHFGWSGRYLGHTDGVGASVHVAVAHDGSLLAAGPETAFHLVEGEVREVDTDAAAVATLVGALPGPEPVVESTADGLVHLGPRCVPPSEPGWFDAHGEPVAAPVVATEVYERQADVVVGPLDSRIDQCAWHRVVLEGALPPGCSVGVDTLTAQVPYAAAELATLPEPAWETRLVATAFDAAGWDGLVRSPLGRYLWLRLRLTGTGATTPRLDEAVVEMPRISLRRHLPAVYGAEPVSADFTDRLLAIFDRSLRDVEAAVDELPALFDPRATAHLDWLASWIGLRPDHRLSEQLRRDLVADAATLLDLRGTPAGLHRLLVAALGLARPARVGCAGTVGARPGCPSCPSPRQHCPPRPDTRRAWEPPPLVLEHFRLRRWLEAGAGTLGDTSVLWGESVVRRSQLDRNAQVGRTALKGTQDPLRDPFHVHAHRFTVFAPGSAGRTQEQRRALERLVAWGSPAHTVGTVEYVAPRLRIGVQSSIGLDTVVARLPGGVTLGATPLGAASVLDGEERRPLSRSALGTTTVLQ